MSSLANEIGASKEHDGKYYDIKLPTTDAEMDQHEEWVLVTLKKSDGTLFEKRILFHDYNDIYQIQGLYEYLFHEKLKCNSPRLIAEQFANIVARGEFDAIKPFRILDVGAGGGMVTEAIVDKLPVAKSMGIDIVPAAKLAAQRDRPDLYDNYLISDLTNLSQTETEEIQTLQPNTLTCISALGFNDIPVEAFKTAYNLVAKEGAIVFSVRDKFMESDDQSGFAHLIKNIINSGALELISKERFFHREAVTGESLYYEGIIGRKIKDI